AVVAAPEERPRGKRPRQEGSRPERPPQQGSREEGWREEGSRQEGRREEAPTPADRLAAEAGAGSRRRHSEELPPLPRPAVADQGRRPPAGRKQGGDRQDRLPGEDQGP